jgi:hypothetical protein
MEVFSLNRGITDFPSPQERMEFYYNAICFSVIILRRLIKP